MITNKQLSEANVQFLGGLIKKVNEITDVIDDNNIKTNGTYSSLKIYEVVQEAIKTSKDYTLEEIAKLTGASYLVVSSVDEMIDQRIIYLLDNGTNFDMYILQGDGSTIQIGTTDINLTDYYTKNEVDNEFLKKTDATGTYATVSALGSIENDVDVHINDSVAHMTQVEKNNIVGKDKIVTSLDNTVTDEQIPSAKVTHNELGKKVDKASITTTLDDTVTDEQVPSAKAVFSTIIDKKGECTTIRHTDLDTVKKGGLYYVQSSCTNLPYNCVGGYMCVIYNDELADTYATQIMLNWNGKKIYFRSLISGTWLNWDIINTTKVEDVGVTELKWTNTTNYEPHGTKCHYTVKNGICYISLDIAVHTPSNAGFILNNSGLPKPAFNYVHANISPYSSTDATLRTLTIAITEASQFVIYNGTAGARYLQTFSYPVAE